MLNTSDPPWRHEVTSWGQAAVTSAPFYKTIISRLALFAGWWQPLCSCSDDSGRTPWVPNGMMTIQLSLFHVLVSGHEIQYRHQQRLTWQNSDSAVANQECIYEKCIYGKIPWIIATVWLGIRCVSVCYLKKMNIRTGLQISSFYLLLWMWNLVSQNKRGTYLDWGRLGTTWWGQHLNIWGGKLHKDGENFVMRSFMICTRRKAV